MYGLEQTVEDQQSLTHPQMAKGNQPIVSQLYMNRLMPLQKLVHTVPLRANHKNKHFCYSSSRT